jgi:AmmeMemoRadiSam system protein A
LNGKSLLNIARASISGRLGIDYPEPALSPELEAWGATFVTLTMEGELRGCIGSLDAHRPLHVDARHNALAAAFSYPRFMPLSIAEWPAVKIEVSKLTKPASMAFSCEEEAIAQLSPGIDGLVFECLGRRSTFLPQVWESLQEPAEFLAQLKRKAGLPGNFWSSDVKLLRYGVEKWKE